MNNIVQIVSQILQNNIGNRLTTELANGILFAIDQAQPKAPNENTPITDITDQP